jgi:hypothetical protein
MKGSTRAAAAIGIGYVLGRRRKLRAATMMAATMAVGSTPMGAMVLKRGLKLVNTAGLLNAVPSEVGEIIDVVRGDLVPAGKAAVSAAASSRVDALTGSLHERAERLRDPGAAVADAADETKRKAGQGAAAAGEGAAAAKRTTGGVAGAAKRKTRRADTDDQADQHDEADPRDKADRPDEAGRRDKAGRRDEAGPRDKADRVEDRGDEEDLGREEDLGDEDYEADEEPDETDDFRDESDDLDEDEDDEEPLTRVRRTSTRRRTPVARARR